MIVSIRGSSAIIHSKVRVNDIERCLPRLCHHRSLEFEREQIARRSFECSILQRKTRNPYGLLSLDIQHVGRKLMSRLQNVSRSLNANHLLVINRIERSVPSVSKKFSTIHYRYSRKCEVLRITSNNQVLSLPLPCVHAGRENP